MGNMRFLNHNDTNVPHGNEFDRASLDPVRPNQFRTMFYVGQTCQRCKIERQIDSE